MQKIKEMVDVNTIVGDPMTTPDGTTIIPDLKKVSFGFASGGADIATKKSDEQPALCRRQRRGDRSRQSRSWWSAPRGHPTDSRCEQCHNRYKIVEMVPEIIDKAKGYVLQG